MHITPSLIDKACLLVEHTSDKSLPFRTRGIYINQALIEAVLEILASCPLNTLPQNCRNDIVARTPDGLDRRIKEKLKTDLRTANIISDILANAGIVKVVKVLNPETGREVKGTRLEDEQNWLKTESEVNARQTKVKAGNIPTHFIVPNSTKQPIGAGISKQEYLNSSYVKDFLGWFELKLDRPGSFKHSYYLKRARFNWDCSCLYEAYENYWWPLKNYIYTCEDRISKNNAEVTFRYLVDLAEKFRHALQIGDIETTSKCVLEMLSWGGVLNKNELRIEAMRRDICSYFKYVQDTLNMEKVHLGGYPAIYINSGFTKLYFLLIDNFIMYDGRVGAALGLLGRLYAEEKELPSVPDSIKFSFGSGRESMSSKNNVNRRNPSTEKYMLPKFSGNQKRHLDDNIKASWLLKSIADNTTSRFSLLSQGQPLNMRVTAIQSALFMIGYDVTR